MYETQRLTIISQMTNTLSKYLLFFRFHKNCAGPWTRIIIQDAKGRSEGWEFYILSSYTRHDSLHLHWPSYSISTHVSIPIFILLTKQLFSKILSPKYHARASKEIKASRTYKSLVNIQTSHVNKGMNSVSQGHKMHSFCRITQGKE